ncbi:MAG: Uma2 family endonuclease [Acidobacteria bacterium]|nr:Uma2 family endonuclease [Acidobacteriota bacterium]
MNRANTAFAEAFGRRAIVSVQNPLRLDIYNEPQPDIVVLRPRADFYASARFTPQDVFFVVEVSHTSLSYDRKIKVPHYAASGVPEVWIENLRQDRILVFRDPEGDSYQSSIVFGRRDSVSPSAFPEAAFKVEDLLG